MIGSSSKKTRTLLVAERPDSIDNIQRPGVKFAFIEGGVLEGQPEETSERPKPWRPLQRNGPNSAALFPCPLHPPRQRHPNGV